MYPYPYAPQYVPPFPQQFGPYPPQNPPQQPQPQQPHQQPQRFRPIARGHSRGRGPYRHPNQNNNNNNFLRPNHNRNNSRFPAPRNNAPPTQSKKSSNNTKKFSGSRKRGPSPPPTKSKKRNRDDMIDDEGQGSSTSGTASTLLSCIIVIGSLEPYLPTNQEVKDFNEAIYKKISDKVFTFSCSNYNFNLKDMKAGYETKACVLKFGEDWFNSLSEDIKKAQVAGTLGHVDAYDAVYACVNEKVNMIKNFYKPKGPIFLLATCKSQTDAIVATYAMLNGHPLIQLDEDGKQKFGDLGGDRKKIARHFAYKIGDKLCQFQNMTRTNNLGAQVTADALIDADSI